MACQLTQISSALVAVNYISGAFFCAGRFVLGKYKIGDGPRYTTVRLVAKLRLLFFRGGEGARRPRGEAAQYNALPYSLHDGATTAHRESPGLKKVTGGIQDAVQMQRMCQEPTR